MQIRRPLIGSVLTLAGTLMLATSALAPAAGAVPAQAPPTTSPAVEPPPAGIGVTLLEGPTSNVDDPRAHTYIIDHVAPGTTISRKVGFSNGDTTPIAVDFYAAAAKISDGAFTVGDDRAANDVSAWTTFSPASATLQPGQTLPVTVTITVPADATRGERYAAALGQRVVLPATAGGVSSVSRVGIRLYLSVGDGEEPVTSFAIGSMSAGRDDAGRPMVEAQVHNTGERAVDLSGDLLLTNGPSALSAGPFPVQTVSTLLPGTSGPVSIALDQDLPNGPWDATITLTSGVTTQQGSATITFPNNEETMARSVPVIPSDSSGFPTTPLIVAAAAAVGAAMVGTSAALLQRGRRVRRGRSAPIASAPAP